jgi:hypothetical protein
VVARNVERLLANYTQLNAANTLGNYSGSLKNSGERVALSRPDYVTTTNSTGGILTNQVYVATAEVTYQNGGRWGTWSMVGALAWS